MDRSGRYSTTPAPTPAAAAAAVLAASASRSMPSSAASPCDQRTTRSSSPSSVVTWRLRLVSPPGRSVTRQARPARQARRSSVGASTRSVVERLDHGLVDRVLRPGEPVLGGDVPPDDDDEQRPQRDDGRVVDELPVELVAE